MTAFDPLASAGGLIQIVDHDDLVQADRAGLRLSFGQRDQGIAVAIHVPLAGGAIHPLSGELFQHVVVDEDHSIEFVPVGEQTNMVVNGFYVLHGRGNARSEGLIPEARP